MVGRPACEVLVSAAAVLVTQLILGLLNELLDVDRDRASEAPGKPVAAGYLPPGNASFAVAVLLLLAIPLSLQNGITAGLLLLSTLVAGYVHNRWLKPTVLSWAGWAATFALLACFVTYGGWGRDADGSAPFPSFLLLCAALGVCVHFLTSLPDLVVDNRTPVRHLPLRLALRLGAPRLRLVVLVLTVVVLASIIFAMAQNAAIAP